MARLFTLKEANAALPQAEKTHKELLDQKREIAQIEAELGASGGSLARFLPAKQKYNAAITRFYSLIERLEGSGAVIKSIDEGLLDFPSERFGQEVWLCWKAGEKEIKFWHERDEGFGGRKPLEVSDESLV